LFGLDGPGVRALVERRGAHARVEGDVLPKVERGGDILGVTDDLRLRGIALGPVPALRDRVGETVLVFHALHVAARARIAVPIPGAADIRPGLEHADREARLA